jgi:hypothetical protein
MAKRSESGRGSGSTATKDQPGNQTPNTPDINESEIAALKVDQLRDRLRRRGITGTADMHKDELVKTLIKAMRDGHKTVPSPRTGTQADTGGGIRTGEHTSKSLRYAQEITSVDEEPERDGRSLVTTDHDVIRRWAEERNGVPATVDGTEHDGRAGVLRFDFRGGESGRLRHIGWDEWFTVFDERRLNFIYQEKRSDGRQSNFFRLESPDREDA